MDPNGGTELLRDHLRRFRQLGQWNQGHSYVEQFHEEIAQCPTLIIEAAQLYLVQGHYIRAWDICGSYAFQIFDHQQSEGAFNHQIHDETLVCLTLLAAFIGISRHGLLRTALRVAQRVHETCLGDLNLPSYEGDDRTKFVGESSSDVHMVSTVEMADNVTWARSLLCILNGNTVQLSDLKEETLLISFYIFKILIVAGEQGLLHERDTKQCVLGYVDRLRHWALHQERRREARYLTYFRTGLTQDAHDNIACLNTLLQAFNGESTFHVEEALTHIDLIECMLALGHPVDDDHVQTHVIRAQKLSDDYNHVYAMLGLQEIQLNASKKNLATSEYKQKKLDLANEYIEKFCYTQGIRCLISAVPVEHDMGSALDQTKQMIQQIQIVITEVGGVLFEQILFTEAVAQSVVRAPEHGYAREALESYIKRRPDEMGPRMLTQLYLCLTQVYASLGNYEKAVSYARITLEAAIRSASPEDASDAAFHYSCVVMSQARSTKFKELSSPLLAISRSVLQTWVEIDFFTNYHTGALEKLVWLAWVEMTVHELLGDKAASSRSDKWIDAACAYSSKHGVFSDELKKAQHMQAMRLENFDVAISIVQGQLNLLKASPSSSAFAIGQAATSVSLALLQKYQIIVAKMVQKEIPFNPSIFDDLFNAIRMAAEAYDHYSKIGGTEMVVASLNFIWKLLNYLSDSAKTDLVAYWLKEAEKVEDFCDSIRRSIPASPNAQSLVDKRLALKSKEYRKLYCNAIMACMETQQMSAAWTWIQKAKARSLCDVFGSRALVPQSLLDDVAADAKASDLFDREQELMVNAISAGPVNYLEARRQIEECRVQMKTHANLRKMLDIREGVLNVDLDDTALTSALESCGYRREVVKYVDWYIPFDATGDTKPLLLVRKLDGVVTMKEVELPISTIETWIKRTLDYPKEAHPPLRRPDALRRLRDLAPLVSTLAELTDEGDLLILSPSGLLNRIPLHALPVNGQPLIVRNPVVYSANAAIFRQCHLRAFAQSSVEQTPSHSSFLSVFETPGDQGEDERDEIHEHAKIVAENVFHFERYEGEAVTKNLFTTAAAQSQWLHYHGHAIFHSQDVFKSCLVLSHGLQELEIDETAIAKDDGHASTRGPRNASEPSSQAVTEFDTHNLAVSDIFAADMQASSPHITVIACDSGSQDISIGDEPTGIIPALLFAGATSAIGTLWPVDSPAARQFSTRFYRALQAQIRNHAEGTENTSSADGSSSSKSTAAKDEVVVVMLNLATALQSAVCDMMKRENVDTKAPVHWAAYVLHGCWFRAYVKGK